MVRCSLVVALLAACGRDVPAPPPRAPRPPVAEMPRAHEVAPIAPPAVAAWRAKLAEAEQLAPLTHFYFTLGSHDIEKVHEQAERELVALVEQLPDDSPDLPEAACHLIEHARDRRAREAQLVRAIAAVRKTANGDVEKLYGSLRANYLSVQVSTRVVDNKVERDPAQEAILGGRPSYSCATPDVGHLRWHLAEMYLSEERYPVDPFTNEQDRGPFTSKKGVANAGIAELEAMYREITALAPDDPAVATLIELASIECAARPLRGTFTVCLDRTSAIKRALDIRERALPADNTALVDSRIVQARMLLTTRKPQAGDTMLRHALADAPRGSPQRLHATLDLVAWHHAHNDAGFAAILARAVIPDLAMPPGAFTWEWSAIGETLADIAVIDRRDADALATLRALDQAFSTPNPLCVPESDVCDNRWTRIHLIERIADLDPANRPALLQQASELRRGAEQLRTRLIAEARRRTRSPSP